MRLHDLSAFLSRLVSYLNTFILSRPLLQSNLLESRRMLNYFQPTLKRCKPSLTNIRLNLNHPLQALTLKPVCELAKLCALLTAYRCRLLKLRWGSWSRPSFLALLWLRLLNCWSLIALSLAINKFNKVISVQLVNILLLLGSLFLLVLLFSFPVLFALFRYLLLVLLESIQFILHELMILLNCMIPQIF